MNEVEWDGVTQDQEGTAPDKGIQQFLSLLFGLVSPVTLFISLRSLNE